MAHVPDRPLGDYWARSMRVPRETYSDARDVARRLGVSRERVGQLARHDRSFPRPMSTWHGRVWWTTGIQAWIALHRPGSVAPDAGLPGDLVALLRLAEEAAVTGDSVGVGTEHLWLALLNERAPGPTRDVLASLGATDADVRDDVNLVWRGCSDRPSGTRMNPRVQEFLWRQANRATEDGTTVDARRVALALTADGRVEPGRDVVAFVLLRRGLDLAELERRLVAASDPAAIAGFERRALGPRSEAKRRRPRDLRHLLPNPLGHDPWDRHPWGSVFARTTADLDIVIDGWQWFFYLDCDGFFIRTSSGHPVGYRWLLPKTSRSKPRRSRTEALPMPPADVAYWPNYRYRPD